MRGTDAKCFNLSVASENKFNQGCEPRLMHLARLVEWEAAALSSMRKEANVAVSVDSAQSDGVDASVAEGPRPKHDGGAADCGAINRHCRRVCKAARSTRKRGSATGLGLSLCGGGAGSCEKTVGRLHSGSAHLLPSGRRPIWKPCRSTPRHAMFQSDKSDSCETVFKW
jgi:hypothetical protein